MNIRKATIGDSMGIAKVHVDSWISTYKGIVPKDYLDLLTYDKREVLWKKNIITDPVFVAEDYNGKIVGFSTGGKKRTKGFEDYDGELYAIYILDNYQGKGIGKALLKQIIIELQENKLNSMIVLVLEQNSSKNFYEHMGGSKIGSINTKIADKELTENIYGWESLENMQHEYL